MNTCLGSHELPKRLTKIIEAIQTLEEVLACISATSDSWTDKSDMGWLLSMVSENPGTILAVLFGRRGRSWDQCARELERTIMMLRIDKRILEWELRKKTHRPGAHG